MFLDRATAAVSIAVINSIGNLGGFAGPSLIGVVKGETGSAATGLMFLSALLLLAFLMTLLMRVDNKEPGQPQTASAH
ncbi:putative tartrate transporter [compost metagenome]